MLKRHADQLINFNPCGFRCSQYVSLLINTPHSTAYSTSEHYTGIYAYLAYQFVSWWRDCPIYRVNVTFGIDSPCTRKVGVYTM